MATSARGKSTAEPAAKADVVRPAAEQQSPDVDPAEPAAAEVDPTDPAEPAAAEVDVGEPEPPAAKPFLSEGVRHELDMVGKVGDPATGGVFERDKETGKVTHTDRAGNVTEL